MSRRLLFAVLGCTVVAASLAVPELVASRPAKARHRAASAAHEKSADGEEEHDRRPAQPFVAESAAARHAVAALPVDTSLGDWRAIGPSNFGGKIYGAAVDPNNGNHVYAAYEVGGLWGTQNGGRSWVPMFDGQQDIAFGSVATHPRVPGLVAAGLISYGSGYFHSLNRDVGIRLSKNGGKTWRNIGPKVDPTATVWNIGFGDATGQTIYAATDQGLYKTTNQGRTWVDALSYAHTGDFFLDRPALAVDPLDPSILLLAQRTIGVLRSTDGGASWVRVDDWVNPGTAAENPTILAWSSDATVYAESEVNGGSSELATYRSTDEGATWTPGATTTEFNQGPYDMAMAVDPFDANHVLVHNSSLQSSSDGLRTLSPSSGAAGPDSLAIAFDPSRQGVVYDGNDEGLHRSSDGGTTWHRFDAGVLTTKSIGGSAYAVGTDGKIYTNAADYNGQLFTKGFGWVPSLDRYEYSESYVNPHDPNDPYNYNDDLWRSPTMSHPLTNIDPTPGSGYHEHNALEFDPVDPNTIYVGKQGLYKSTNRGDTWTKLGTIGLDGAVQLVKVAPSNPQHIYVASNNQLWRSTDGGATWTVGASTNAISMISVSPADDNTLYLATQAGLVESTDGGATVNPLSAPAVNMRWVLVDPAVPTQVYAATNDTALVSKDGGATWARLGTQLPLVEVEWMTVVGRNLYAGTGADVWEMNLTGVDPCSQVTFNPPSLTVASAAGTDALEIFVADECSWTATSGQPWAKITTYGATHGHAVLAVDLSDNTAGATRKTTLQIAGQSIPITQLGGPDAVRDAGTVTISNASGCLTVAGSHVYRSTCTPSNQLQQFTLHAVPDSTTSYFITNAVTGVCLDVEGGLVQDGSTIFAPGCVENANEVFLIRPRGDDNWWIRPGVTLAATPLCLAIAPSTATETACTRKQELTVHPA